MSNGEVNSTDGCIVLLNAEGAVSMTARRLQQQLPNVLKQLVGRARLHAGRCGASLKSLGFEVVVGRERQNRNVASLSLAPNALECGMPSSRGISTSDT